MSAKEQTLKTVVDQLLRRTPTTAICSRRAPRSSIARSRPSTRCRYLLADGWATHEFPPESDQSGLLTQISFLGLFSHPGRSSPTKRGVAINEILLCEPTPLPPANVDFSIVNDTTNPNLRTVRSPAGRTFGGRVMLRLPSAIAIRSVSRSSASTVSASIAARKTASRSMSTAKLSGKKFRRRTRAWRRRCAKIPRCRPASCATSTPTAPGERPDKTDRGIPRRSSVKAFVGERLSLSRAPASKSSLSPEFFKVVVAEAAPADAPKPPESTIAENTCRAAAGASFDEPRNSLVATCCAALSTARPSMVALPTLDMFLNANGVAYADGAQIADALRHLLLGPRA